MKALNLSLTQSVGFNIPLEALAEAEPGKPITFNILDACAKVGVDSEYKQARMNAVEVITATIQFEHKISHFIGDVLCGIVHEGVNPLLKQRNFLGQHLLESKYLSFDARRALLSELIEEFKFVSTTKRKALISRIKKIGMYRNAFAHGEMKYHEDRGITLDYHADGRKSDKLNDAYWQRLELIFREAKEQFEFVEKQYSESPYFTMWLPERAGSQA